MTAAWWLRIRKLAQTSFSVSAQYDEEDAGNSGAQRYTWSPDRKSDILSFEVVLRTRAPACFPHGDHVKISEQLHVETTVLCPAVKLISGCGKLRQFLRFS